MKPFGFNTHNLLVEAALHPHGIEDYFQGFCDQRNMNEQERLKFMRQLYKGALEITAHEHALSRLIVDGRGGYSTNYDKARHYLIKPTRVLFGFAWGGTEFKDPTKYI